MLVVFLLSGQIDLALEVGALEATLKIGLYYFHERTWKPPPPQPQPRHRLTSASLSGLLPHGGRIEEGGTARAAPRADRDNGPPAARPLLRHGRAVVVDH